MSLDIGLLSSVWNHINMYPVCNLATIDSLGRPDNRVMGYVPLLIDAQNGLRSGFILAMNTDAGTRKIGQLEKNPNVSLTIGQEWPAPTQLAPYVRLKGRAKSVVNPKTDELLRKNYFRKYPEAEQLFEEPERVSTIMILAVIDLLEYIADPSINPPEGIETFPFENTDKQLQDLFGVSFTRL